MTAALRQLFPLLVVWEEQRYKICECAFLSGLQAKRWSVYSAYNIYAQFQLKPSVNV